MDEGVQLDWLSTINIGDEVGVLTHNFTETYEISKVVSITQKTRQITVGSCGNAKFKNGIYRGGGFGISYLKLVPITEEFKEKLFRQEAVNTLKTTDYSKLSTEALKKLVNILKEGN
jgi:hypothetical protein